jgi:cytochrome bd ubiquinol oxidase subunit II
MTLLTYDTLRLLWWAVLGILLIGIAVMDGFDLGSAILLPVAARSDVERRVIINTVGPVWEGNQVWLILGGGAIFAAWPPLYAVAFSGFYLAMLLLLASLILRPVGFKFRSKLEHARWRLAWDCALFVGGLVPALVFGVAFGNVLQGVPFTFDADLRMTYGGSLWGLFNPFALLCGLVSVAMITLHGATWLAARTEGTVQARARLAAPVAATVMIALFVLGGAWAMHLDGYVLVGDIAADGPSNPLLKHVAQVEGALVEGYARAPLLLLAPMEALLGAALAGFLSAIQRFALLAWIGSALAIAGTIATAGLSLFPFLLPSSSDPRSSLTVWDASSSHATLGVMTVATAIFLPLIIAYTSWVYWVLRGKITAEAITRDNHSFY